MFDQRYPSPKVSEFVIIQFTTTKNGQQQQRQEEEEIAEGDRGSDKRSWSDEQWKVFEVEFDEDEPDNGDRIRLVRPDQYDMILPEPLQWLLLSPSSSPCCNKSHYVESSKLAWIEINIGDDEQDECIFFARLASPTANHEFDRISDGELKSWMIDWNLIHQ